MAGSTSTNWTSCLRRASAATARRRRTVRRRLSAGRAAEGRVLNRLESLTGCRPAGRVMLLTQLRYFGFHFNPVNFYYCYDEADTLRWVLAEVRNTPWNERHYYAVDGQQARPLEKAFHVSPFNPMDISLALQRARQNAAHAY